MRASASLTAFFFRFLVCIVTGGEDDELRRRMQAVDLMQKASVAAGLLGCFYDMLIYLMMVVGYQTEIWPD